MTDGLIVLSLVGIVIIGLGVLFLLNHGRGTGKALDVERYRRSWMQIERQLVRDNEQSYHLAILNADKLLDQALKQLHVKGDTMGERMKVTTWSNPNAVWASHKLRNRVAHENDVVIRYDEARRALAGFKQGLRDIGAI